MIDGCFYVLWSCLNRVSIVICGMCQLMTTTVHIVDKISSREGFSPHIYCPCVPCQSQMMIYARLPSHKKTNKQKKLLFILASCWLDYARFSNSSPLYEYSCPLKVIHWNVFSTVTCWTLLSNTSIKRVGNTPLVGAGCVYRVIFS